MRCGVSAVTTAEVVVPASGWVPAGEAGPYFSGLGTLDAGLFSLALRSSRGPVRLAEGALGTRWSPPVRAEDLFPTVLRKSGGIGRI